MNLFHPLYSALGINGNDRKQVKNLSKNLNVSIKVLDYYNNNNILPDKTILNKIIKEYGISKLELQLKMGIYSNDIKRAFSKNADDIIQKLNLTKYDLESNHKQVFDSEFGTLYHGDCLSLLSVTADNSFDLIFADPPFNLDKYYPSRINDKLSHLEYISWTERWLDECIRTLNPGGSLFIWNLPKWNSYFSEYLNHRLTFRNWITVDIKYSLPIQSKLYPSHYSLLYYCKGERPRVFHPDRIPINTCPKCFTELKDYGGYKNKMNSLGINLSDVWNDIPPVRHNKYKKRKGANELSLKLLDRVIEMSSDPGDVIFDPFGGSGTTYICAEIKGRNWIGVELGGIDVIINRFNSISAERKFLKNFRSNINKLFPDDVKKKRISKGMWTDETFKKGGNDGEIIQGNLNLFEDLE